MTATDLLSHLADFTAPEAERWLTAALAEAAALRAASDRLYPLVDDPGAMEQARHLHAAWQNWANAAEAVIERIRREPALGGQHLHGVFDLNVEIAFARGLAKMPLEDLRRRYQAVARGEGARYSSVKELRRELGLPSEPRRSA